MTCNHPDHQEGVSCADRAVSCSRYCRCCNDEATILSNMHEGADQLQMRRLPPEVEKVVSNWLETFSDKYLWQVDYFVDKLADVMFELGNIQAISVVHPARRGLLETVWRDKISITKSIPTMYHYLVKGFVHQFGDKYVWQVDSFIKTFANRMFELGRIECKQMHLQNEKFDLMNAPFFPAKDSSKD